MGLESILSVLGSGATAFVFNGRFSPETYLNCFKNIKLTYYVAHRRSIV